LRYIVRLNEQLVILLVFYFERFFSKCTTIQPLKQLFFQSLFMKIFHFILPLFLLQAQYLKSQSHYLLDNISAIKDKERVIINWTIKKGSSCIGIGIFRSTNATDYEVIGEIKGVCGSTEFAQAYHFIDENPIKNKTNYYVLEMGFSGKTAPALAVQFVDVGTNKSKVIPNPLSGFGRIYFENPNNEYHTLSIFDAIGKRVIQYKSNEDYFKIYLTGLEEIEPASFNFNTSKYFYYIIDNNGNKVSSGIFIDISN